MKANPESRSLGNVLPQGEIWDLNLYVIDRNQKSVAAIDNLTRICHEHLEGKCHIAVIDIEKSPQLAKKDQIVAIPTLVKAFPLPMRRVIGDLSNTDRVLTGLDLHPMIKNDLRKAHPLHGRP